MPMKQSQTPRQRVGVLAGVLETQSVNLLRQSPEYLLF